MKFFIVVIIGGIFSSVLGLYTRYILFMLFSNRKTLDYLKGKDLEERETHKQLFANRIVGIIMLTIISVILATCFPQVIPFL